MEDVFVIKVAGEDVDVKMTYGLLDVLARMAGDTEGALMFNLDHDLRSEVTNALLAKRDDKGRIKEEVNIFTLDVSPDEHGELINWAGAHVLDFFIKRATLMKKVGDERKDSLKALRSSSNGGETSAS